MTDAQASFYDDYERLVGRLASIAGRRPLRKEEFEKLQRYLACMRMVCDTPYILDDKPYECPKMDELERLLPDLLDDPGCKIIVFSEWVRMLALVRGYALGAVWNSPGIRAACRSTAAARRSAGSVKIRIAACSSRPNPARGAQPASGERRRQHGPALESGAPGAAHRPRLAQAPDPPGDRHQPGERGHHRAPHARHSWTPSGRWRTASSTGAATSGGSAMPGGRAAFLERLNEVLDAEPKARRAKQRLRRRPSRSCATTWPPNTARRCSGSSCARARARARAGARARARAGAGPPRWWWSPCPRTVSPRRSAASTTRRA